MLTLIILIIVVALVFDFLNGFHDAANSIATVVSTDSPTGLTPITASPQPNSRPSTAEKRIPPRSSAGWFGWTNVALMCGHEMSVPGSLQMCLRVMLHVNTDRSQDEINHVYLRGAAALRPDLSRARD